LHTSGRGKFFELGRMVKLKELELLRWSWGFPIPENSWSVRLSTLFPSTSTSSTNICAPSLPFLSGDRLLPSTLVHFIIYRQSVNMVQFSEETKVGPSCRRAPPFQKANPVSSQERVSKVIDISRVAIH
jgi:hypothetical protein